MQLLAGKPCTDTLGLDGAAGGKYRDRETHGIPTAIA